MDRNRKKDSELILILDYSFRIPPSWTKAEHLQTAPLAANTLPVEHAVCFHSCCENITLQMLNEGIKGGFGVGACSTTLLCLLGI